MTREKIFPTNTKVASMPFLLNNKNPMMLQILGQTRFHSFGLYLISKKTSKNSAPVIRRHKNYVSIVKYTFIFPLMLHILAVHLTARTKFSSDPFYSFWGARASTVSSAPKGISLHIPN